MRYVVTVLAVICLLLAACSKRDIPSTRPLPILTAWVAASGESMLPTFPERSLVEIQTVPFDQLKAGDTVIFWDYTADKPRFIHHRLIQKQAGNWIARGDNPTTNPRADAPWVTKDNYIARTTGRHAQLLTP